MNRNGFAGGGPGGRNFRYQDGPMPPRGADYDKPDRPGQYFGSRPFRMDKMRNEPLERDDRGPQMSGKEFRDNRNRPGLNDRR